MQSLNNTIITYGAKDRVSLNKKKKFSGHRNAGYGIQVGASPDGQYVLSGDEQGRCFFWDWKTTRICKTIKAHTGTCSGATWHPADGSKVISCGWKDGLIKLWN
jgi:pre-mRNA-processing factor 17